VGDARGSADDVVRVLIVGEDTLARAGLSSLLAREEGVVSVGQCSGEGAYRRAAALRAHAALWDLDRRSAPEYPGFSETARSLPVLALTADSSRALEALASGARGVLPRDIGADRLASALRAVALGLRVLDETAAAAALRLDAGGHEPPLEPLTPRESEVLEQLSLGSTNKEIARRLGISEHTAKFHVNAILAKLDAASRTEAVVKAARLGLVVL
jgi:two-component system nitrate/nitrite response regulator NarL